MLYIKLFIEREKNIGQSAPECPFKQYKLVPVIGWEGRSGFALAMRHRLSGISTYGLNGLGKGNKHPA